MKYLYICIVRMKMYGTVNMHLEILKNISKPLS